MPQFSGTFFLTRLVQHATLSESGPIRVKGYLNRKNVYGLNNFKRVNSLKVACHYTQNMGNKGNVTVKRDTSFDSLITAFNSESVPLRACSYTRDNPLVT